MKLTIGSRGSQLALWQARWVAARLAELGVETELLIIKTTGDKITDVPLAKVGSKGLFTKEIEDALLDGRIDLAVHSLKDLPTVLPAGLMVAAFPERETPLDALIGHSLATLPQAAKVGTSSLRRAAQLKRLRPDLSIESVRGNLDTRLRKLDEGQFDAIMLAGAGLRRLGWASRIAELLPADLMCPAVGQGALAIETRDDAGQASQICSRLDHPPTRAAVTAERAVLASLGGGCQVPIGAYATVDGDLLRLRSIVIDPDSGALIADQTSGPVPDAESIGAAAAGRLLDSGARSILAAIYDGALPLAGQRVLVARARNQAAALSSRLRAAGAGVVELPAIEILPLPFTPPDWPSYQWAIFTSANAVDFFFDKVAPAPGPRICAIGPATAEALCRRGLEPNLVPAQFVAESVVAALSSEPIAGQRILLPRAAAARDLIPDQLSKLGATVDVLPVYETRVPAGLRQTAQTLFASAPPHWIALTSASTVKHLYDALGPATLSRAKLASIGPITSDAARALGLAVAVEASPSTIDALVKAIADAIARQLHLS
ncbi:MAG: hydroxymethylbilane synthase [Candidatus Solibacter usitatus]|nr:hydroxymethylbilane synthase [Candidatus Solibacter usitatus]